MDLKKEKLVLEDALTEEGSKQSKDVERLEELEQKVKEQEETILQLEKRRETAKKEIKMLNYKLEKQKSIQSTSNTGNSS